MTELGILNLQDVFPYGLCISIIYICGYVYNTNTFCIMVLVSGCRGSLTQGPVAK